MDCQSQTLLLLLYTVKLVESVEQRWRCQHRVIGVRTTQQCSRRWPSSSPAVAAGLCQHRYYGLRVVTKT